MKLNQGEIDLNEYALGSWKPKRRLVWDLEKRINSIIEKDSDFLEELDYNNPVIEENQIYILKTGHPDDRYGSKGRRIELEVEVGMDWEEEVGIYERVCFGRYVAIVKFPRDSLPPFLRNPDVIFGIMLNPDKTKKGVRTDSGNVVSMSNRLEYPLYFSKGSHSCASDDYAGYWTWYDSYGNDYGFPTGSVWAKLSTPLGFLNWNKDNPLEGK